MRKNGRAIVFALLLLLVPVLANAWTLTTRVYGPSSAGEVVIQAGDATGAVLKTINAGVEYVQVPNGTAAYVTVTANGYNAAEVLVDYVKEAPADFYVVDGNSGNHQLTVNFGIAADAKGNVSVNKAAGGTTLVQYNGASSMTGFTNLTFGTAIGVKASPRADYKVTGITVTKTSAGGTETTETPAFTAAGAGQAVTVGVTVDQAVVEVSAAYELVASAKAMFSAPLKAVTGKPVTLSAAGTTANTAVTYEFVVGGSVVPASSSQTYTFTPTVAGPLTVTLNVKSGAATLATKTASINVVPEGVVYNNLCLGCHTGSTPATIAEIDASAHKGQTCTGCHTDAPHNSSVVPVSQANPEVSCAACHGELSESRLQKTPFADEIAARFNTSRHGNQSARAGFCSACHSHEGFVAQSAMGKMTNYSELVTAYTAETADAYLLPVGSSTIVGVMKKNCFTCHDSESHNMDLRGVGDEVVDGLLGGGGATITQSRTVYSAEFNLCTACHQVTLDATWDPTAGYSERGMFRYALSADYAAENLISAETGTYDFSKLFYHDGASGTGRTYVDTHFAGTIASHLVKFDGSTANVTLVGYNVNPGSANACTACHDPHTAGKMLALNATGSTVAYADTNGNDVLGYAEGIGQTHGNYIINPFSRDSSGCTPCHTGRDFVKLTVGASLSDLGSPKWHTLGCASCHDLAQANATAGTNNAAAFANVRQFPDTHVFAFKSQATVAAADLGVSQICFECHKGRDGLKADAATTTHVYNVNYLHYLPTFAILFGNDSAMVPTYAGKTYQGRTDRHKPADRFLGCTDCHNVHTGKLKASNPIIASGADCMSCHGEGQWKDFAGVEATNDLYEDRLFATILAKRQLIDPTETAESLETRIKARYSSSNAAASDMGSNALAKAGAIWKNFHYDEPFSWAHNKKFSRQLMYDAIEDLGGDLTGLTRP